MQYLGFVDTAVAVCRELGHPAHFAPEIDKYLEIRNINHLLGYAYGYGPGSTAATIVGDCRKLITLLEIAHMTAVRLVADATAALVPPDLVAPEPAVKQEQPVEESEPDEPE